MDLYLTPAEVAELLGISVQAVHKICKENGIETQAKGERNHKVYPTALEQLLRLRGITKKTKKVFTIHTLKGGVGKSTLCHALGTRASAYGFKTLCIDLDKQANLTNSFGISDDDEMFTMLELYEKYYADKKSYNYKEALFEITPYLHLIPARLELANLDLAVQMKAHNPSKLFANLLDAARDDYDLIIFDLPADFNRITMSAHVFSDLALIPINMDTFSIKGLKLTQTHIDYVKREYGGKGEFKVIINKFDARNTLSFELMADLKMLYKDSESLCSKVIPVSKPIETALANGESIWNLSRSKVQALEGFEGVLFDLLEMNSWKAAQGKSATRKTSEASAWI
jgi:chromosome partitioning protein